MKKLELFILDILADDMESPRIIEAELNNRSLPEKDILIDNEDYYSSRNKGVRLTWGEIEKALQCLVSAGLVDTAGQATDWNRVRSNRDDVWLRLTAKGRQILEDTSGEW